MNLRKDEYFADDCIIKDSLYLSLKELITCSLCQKILKNPYMCVKCQKSYCKKCLEENYNLKICPNDKEETQIVHSVLADGMLSKLKYKCKNCFKEVIQSDINAHLEENCRHVEIEHKKTLAEEIKTKKGLIKLSSEEMNNKKIDKTLTSKNNFLNKFIFNKYSHNFRRFWSRKD